MEKLTVETNVYPAFQNKIFRRLNMSKKKRFSFLTVAALALAMIGFSGCDTAITDGSSNPALELDVSRSVVREINLAGTVWLAATNDVYGVSRLDFTDEASATGKFGNNNFNFAYSIGDDGVGVLLEPSTKYSWPFTYTGNDITFENGLPPYTKTYVTFRQITFITSADLSNLSGSHWLGLGPRGESLLDDVAPTGTGTYSLTGSFGPDKPNPFNIRDYKYSGGTSGTGGGDMYDGGGIFTATGSSATLYFPNFWGHAQVTFYKFIYN
jgi:hypothetical protein